MSTIFKKIVGCIQEYICIYKYLRQDAFILGVLLFFRSAKLPLSYNTAAVMKGYMRRKANYLLNYCFL